jgi:signal transduction histidine kinase
LEIIKKPNKFSTNNKIAFISVISSLSVLYLINNIVSIEYFSKYISLPVYAIIPGMLIILSIWALSRADKIQDISKKSLFFLVLSFVSWFAAEQTWNLYEHVLAIDPYPSIADFFYISAPILMFISLIIFLQSQRSKIKKTDVIFANVVSILILIPMLVITFQSNSETEFFEITVAMIYPIVDTALLIPAIIAILFSLRGEKNSFWAMILIGIIIFVIADDLFLFLVIYDGYYDGNPVDILWLSSYIVWTFAIYNLIHRSKKIENGQEQNDDYKYQTNRLTKYGINIALILIVCTTIAIIVVLNYFWSLQADSNFMLFFSLILITLLVVFSSIIVLLNSKLTKALEIKSVKINELSNELIKSERLSAIGELAARLSHDLRNPLSVIKGSVEITMLRNKDTFSTQDNDAIQRINNAIIRMTSQIEDVLNYVKQTPIEKKDVSVLTCIKNSISEIPIPTKIKLTVQENDVWIYADEIKLEVVFSNLIRNAVEAIGNDVGSIEIKIQEDEKQVIVDIIDSGIGIKGDDINQIFEPLYTTKQTGTGLGLVSCKNIVEQHGGKISVKNNPTTFTIRLPKKSTD